MFVVVRRAPPLPPDQRRAAILEATVPLLREHGLAVTTRQIAQAAGVAEGTLFRVFPDKHTLVHEAVVHALAPDQLLTELADVDRSLALRDRLLAITTLVQHRLRSVIELMSAVRMSRPPEDEPANGGGGARAAPPRPRHAAVLDAIAELLEPDRDQLAWSPHEVARLLRLITFAGTHVGITDGEPLSPPEIVAVLLDGVRRRDLTT